MSKIIIPPQYTMYDRNQQLIYLIAQKENVNIYVNDSVRFEGINIVSWTRYIRHAMWFFTEGDVEEYKALYVAPRNAAIIRISVGDIENEI